MQDLLKDAAIEVAELLKRFSFDLNELTAEQLTFIWLDQYPARWVPLSLVEALYQGRYKAVSIEHILRLWQRRGQPLYHFNHEFERIIRGRFSRNLLTHSTAISLNTQTIAQFVPLNEHDTRLQPLSSAAIEETVEEISEETIEEISDIEAIQDMDSEVSELDQLSDLIKSSEWEEFSIVSISTPSLEEAKADLLEFTDPDAESAIQPFSDRLKLLSSEESIAFLKLRSFENDTPLHPLSKASLKDAPIQAFRPIPEIEAINKLKWAKLAIVQSIEQSSDEPFSTEQIHQFIPIAVSPVDFYSKLKAVAGEFGKADPSDSLFESATDI
jgi:hypothetical protein